MIGWRSTCGVEVVPASLPFLFPLCVLFYGMVRAAFLVGN